MTGVGGPLSGSVSRPSDKETANQYGKLVRKLRASNARVTALLDEVANLKHLKNGLGRKVEALEAEITKLKTGKSKGKGKGKGKGNGFMGTAQQSPKVAPAAAADKKRAASEITTEGSSTEPLSNKKPRSSKNLLPDRKPLPFLVSNMTAQNQNGVNAADPASPHTPLPFPAPPAIPPVLNPNGIHFQPQTPSTQFGPITRTYIPRRDPPGMRYFAGPVAGFSQVTGQGVPLYHMSGYAVPGGYMMGPRGPMVPPPSYMPGTAMPAMVMPGIHGVTIAPGTPAAGIAYPGMHPLMQMPNGHGQPAFLGNSMTPDAQQPRVLFEPSLGIGLTRSERLAADIEYAKKEGCFDPQDFMPVNKDPYKEWWVEELDGDWGLYQRRQIDKLKHKWCVRDGWFYAKRLEAAPDV